MWLGDSSEKKKYRNRTSYPRSGRAPHLWHNAVLRVGPGKSEPAERDSFPFLKFSLFSFPNIKEDEPLALFVNDGRNKDKQCQKRTSW